MQALPHRYAAVASAHTDGSVALNAPGLQTLDSASPPEFGGPGDRWSPETLLVAAIADCFVLTFRAVATSAQLPWLSLTCDVAGTLDRIDRVTQFTAFHARARLHIPLGGNQALARRLLERAEHACLISNSLKAQTTLAIEILEAAGADASLPTAAPAA